MKKQRRLLSIVTAAALTASMLLTGCGGNKEENTPPAETESAAEVTAADITEAETEAAAEAAAETAMPDQSYDFSKTAMEYLSGMKAGWNVGNSLDAVGNGMASETGWGNPKISKELIDSVKAAGFDTVRIPVTWMGHIGGAPDYTIDADWMARVNEVVDYVIGNDMYAIINIHHDGNDTPQAWLECEPDDEEAMKSQFAALWTQIAENFADYGDKLMFAGMNEFHHGYSSPKSDYTRLTNELNQLFVDTVRATGGHNGERYLVVQAYNTNADHAINFMTIPTDTIEDHLIAEVHFYDPWNFAGEGKGDWGKAGTETDNWGQEEWVDTIFQKLSINFGDQNVPVIVGEYGCTTMKNEEKTDFRRYYVEYVTKAMKDNGLLPIIWDNGYDGTNGEGFALFNRHTGAVLHQDIIDGIMRACGDDYEVELPQ